jgi:hypothetical protein
MQRKLLVGSSSEFRNECLTENFTLAYAVSGFQTLISHSETNLPILKLLCPDSSSKTFAGQSYIRLISHD